MLYGLLNLSVWGYLIAGFILTQITIASVTLYLHRCQTHRALDFHPIVSHFFRLWLWLTTGMQTADWVAIHRKHHAMTETGGDPHSPKILGLRKVLWQGTELYRAAAADKAMVAKYSHGTPKDWIERHLYSKYTGAGIRVMLLINLLLFGLPGISIWAFQMMWIPFWAAGVVNGVAHYWGYRNFECPDASTNLFPWGFWIGGEELHNNHHAYASSAKFSVKWWEFDLGWLYIRCLALLGLAKVKKLPPLFSQVEGKRSVDLETVRAVIANRFQVLSVYYKQVIRPILRYERQNHVDKQDKSLFHHAGRLLKREESLLTPHATSRLKALLNRCDQLREAYHHREALRNVWLKTAASQKELVEALQQWCKQAEESGLEVLSRFASQLKGYVPRTSLSV